MAISFLKKAKDMMPDRSIKFLLHKHFSGFDPARSLQVIHASELPGKKASVPASTRSPMRWISRARTAG